MLSTLGDRFNLILIYLLYFTASVATQDTNITIPLNDSMTYDNREIYGAFLTLNGVSNVKVEFSNINTNLTFIVFQAHSHLNNITLYNYTSGDLKDESVTGINVGLVNFMDHIDKYLIVNYNENVTVCVYISVHGYLENDPIPGGCNMEFSVQTPPFLRTVTNSDYILVDAAAPSIDRYCISPMVASMKFYMMYLPEMNFYSDVYFDGIRKMMSLKNIEMNGYVIPNSSWPETRRMLSAYPGTGAVYVVVAKWDYYNNSYSVYVPAYTSGCSDIPGESCEMISDWFSQILCAILLFVGAFMCFFGHRFFKTEMFFAGFFSGVIITYILIAVITVVDNKPALLAGAALSGIFFGAIWWLFWWLYGIPVLAVLLPTLNLGFLLAAIFYYRLPGHPLYLENDFNFWSLFILVVMLTALAVVSVTYAANIICCAILGAYATVLSIDYYMGSNLKFILINVIRRAIVPRFNKAVLAPPFEWKDITVILIWVALATLGFLFQHWHNRGRPPFPPPPRAVRPSMNEPIMYGAVGRNMGRPERDANAPPIGSRVTERTRLLA